MRMRPVAVFVVVMADRFGSARVRGTLGAATWGGRSQELQQFSAGASGALVLGLQQVHRNHRGWCRNGTVGEGPQMVIHDPEHDIGSL